MSKKEMYGEFDVGGEPYRMTESATGIAAAILLLVETLDQTNDILVQIFDSIDQKQGQNRLTQAQAYDST